MKRIQAIVLWGTALLATAIALLMVESDLLWKVQQNDLFLFSSLFFKQQMVMPGGMLSYLGTFFTQFFFHTWQGVILLCGWWLLLLWLTKRAFSIPDRWDIVTLVPVALLLISNMDLGYWVYSMKLRGYFFAATIGTTAAAALLWGFCTLPDKLWLRIVYIVLSVLVGYPLMGVYALATTLLMAVWTWRLSKSHIQGTILTISALVAVLGIPLFYYHYIYYQINLNNIYWAALPDFAIRDVYSQYFIPYYLLAGCFLAFVLIFGNASTNTSTVVPLQPQRNKGKNGKKEKKDRIPLLHLVTQGGLFVVLIAAVWHFWYKDDNFHHELRMQRCIEQADWDGVLEEGQKQNGEPTRAIVMMHNLALSRLGRQCDEMYNFPKGSKRSNTPLPIFMYTTAGRLIYYQYGMLNECHRMCLEQGVEKGWSVELLQYLTRCSLLDGETQAVRKYLTLIRQTLFYGSWADHMEQLLTHPKQKTQDKETRPITHMMHYGNIMSSDNGYVEKYLMNLLATTDSDDAFFQEQAVLAAMWTRDPNNFWPRFMNYVQLRPNAKMPRIFLEAACLFGHMQQMNNIDQIPQKEILNSYNAFMRQMQQYSKTQPQNLRTILYPQFGNTYYYEYFFLKDITYF